MGKVTMQGILTGRVNAADATGKDGRMAIGQKKTESAAECVRMEISKEGIHLLQESKMDLQEGVSEIPLQEENMEQMLKQFQEELKSSREQEDHTADYAKIMEIARRISNGDKVPAYDEKKLMEYSAEMYQMAKAAALLHQKGKRKEYDSLYDEEEEGSGKAEKLRELEGEASMEPMGTEPISESSDIE